MEGKTRNGRKNREWKEKQGMKGKNREWKEKRGKEDKTGN